MIRHFIPHFEVTVKLGWFCSDAHGNLWVAFSAHPSICYTQHTDCVCTKTIQISEVDNFQTKIEALTGEAAASHALVEQVVADLKANSAAMTTQKNGIDKMIQVLVEKRTVLEDSIASNAAFIAKLEEACGCDKCSE